ncbi:MAG: TRAP transporter large permease subunit [Planctomycetota bacterium]|jgi:tripartite ATP-independent transporter DctM subunit|nr:TRAP transporter large permease subunit [Planctomycetota bacterium]
MLATLIIFLVGLVVFIVIGIPIAFALLSCSVVLMFHLNEFDPQIVAQRLVAGGSNFALMAIPFFILAGEVMNAGGLSQRIVDLPLKLFGHVRGGLGYVAIVATVIMASLSGSAVADTAAIASILLPMMRQAGYPILTAAGLVSAGGIIAPIIPPSMPFILFGVTGNVSIFRLFMGGIVPGLIMGLGLMITWFFHNRRLNLELQPRASLGEILRTAVSSVWALALPVIIIGGFRIGVFTATEAGAVAAGYAMIVGFLVYRELKFRIFYQVLVGTVKTVGVVMFLVAAANVSAYLMAVAQLPDAVAEIFGPLIESPRLLMLTIMLFTLFVGMVMDLSPAILILVPVLMPLVRQAGINETYFGILFTLNLCIGLITPPVGNVLNVITGIAKIKFDEAARGVFPYLCAHVAVLAVLIAWPDLTIVPLRFFTAR